MYLCRLSLNGSKKEKKFINPFVRIDSIFPLPPVILHSKTVYLPYLSLILSSSCEAGRQCFLGGGGMEPNPQNVL